MVTVKARVQLQGQDVAPTVPLVIPDLGAVRRFAARLHAKRKAWRGEAFGWPAEYNPARPEPPLDSKMTFTPADFCIGESGIWFFSLMWEHGNTAAPVEFLDDRNILGTYRSRGARMRTEEDELREHQEAVRRVDPSRRRHPATKVKIGKWEIEEDELERQHQEAEERGKARAQRTAGQGG